MLASGGVYESSPSALSVSLLLSESGGVGGMSADTLRNWVFSSRVIGILIMNVVVRDLREIWERDATSGAMGGA